MSSSVQNVARVIPGTPGYETTKTSMMQLLQLCRIKIKTCFHLFIILIWLGTLIYYTLALLLDTQFKSHKIMFDGKIDDIESNDLMREIGFIEPPNLFPQAHHEEDGPVFVMTLTSAEFYDFFGFLRTMRMYYPNYKLVIYDIDLTDEDYNLIRINCFCVIRKIHWYRYPDHVQTLKYRAYKPLLVQETLDEFGSVFWLDASVRFTSSDIWMLLTEAKDLGLMGWPLIYPTSTLTHYNTFRYLNTSHNKYFFHRMIDPSRTVYYNTEKVHREVMLPWVKCALDVNCIAPWGSQPQGCNFLRKPRYIYAGCHQYEMSALNVILAKAYNFDTPYITDKKLFKVAPPRGRKLIPQSRNWTSLMKLS